jgi:8-oxo-dGTP diphosphatase
VKKLLARLYQSIPVPLVRLALRFVHTRFNVTAVGIFFDEHGRVLVLHHVYRHHHSWGLPAGFINASESPEMGILRELEEETGLSAQVTSVLSVTSLTRRHLEVALVGVIDSNQVASYNHEIFESAFVGPSDLPAGFPLGQKSLVERALHPAIQN